MASGLPVVCTATAGVSSFATANVDCLMAPAGRPAELAQHVLSVLEDASLAARLATAARQTAQRFTPDRVVQQLERVLYSLTACRQELMALRLQALHDSQLAAAAAVKACAGAAAAHKAALKARQQREAAALAASGVLERPGRLSASPQGSEQRPAAAQQAAADARQSLEQQHSPQAQQHQQQQQQPQQSAASLQRAVGQEPLGSPTQASQPGAGQRRPSDSPPGSGSASPPSLEGSSSSAATREQSTG